MALGTGGLFKNEGGDGSPEVVLFYLRLMIDLRRTTQTISLLGPKTLN
jgi:hypothetical protein